MFICATRKSRCTCVALALLAICAGGISAWLHPLPLPASWLYLAFATALFSLGVNLSLLILSATMGNPLVDETELYRPFICRCLCKYSRGLTVGAVLTIIFSSVYLLFFANAGGLLLHIMVFLVSSSFWLTVIMLFLVIWGVINCMCKSSCRVKC